MEGSVASNEDKHDLCVQRRASRTKTIPEYEDDLCERGRFSSMRTNFEAITVFEDDLREPSSKTTTTSRYEDENEFPVRSRPSKSSTTSQWVIKF
ncbi:hypothetical protein E2C01_054710 [Portunus trituberculatus]|uniref:Uncharacterized protein n=1 Tax=Portunus trituberculatus TaxID=210409 RepID=A0A5B7GTF1_PORTR|nr:hypothetical protein [Portunus trituberculatus]